jgi:short-subunit dehydrogenase
MQSKNGNRRSLVIGSRGGIGSALVKKLINCDTLNSTQLNLDKPEDIKLQNFSDYDYIFNVAGHSKGTFLGFQKNSYQNIISQISVNFVSNILILKRYAEQKKQGTYIWISSDVVDHPRLFHSVYASSKIASQYAMNLIKDEIKHIKIKEIKIGFTKTNFRYNNFLGTKSKNEVDTSYDNDGALDPNFVANEIIKSLNNNKYLIHIK